MKSVNNNSSRHMVVRPEVTISEVVDVAVDVVATVQVVLITERA